MKKTNGKWLAGIFVAGAMVGATACWGQTPSLDDYTTSALSLPGSAAKGKALFMNEQKLACSKCHTADGTGGRTGPDLSCIATKFSRRELIRSVLEPSAAIAVGYETTVIETKAGETYQGVIKQTGDDWVALMGADGKSTRFEAKDIQQRHSSAVSVMPEGLQAGLSLEDFSDLIAYLGSLRHAAGDEMGAGTLTSIPPAVKAAEFPVFFSTNVIFKAPLWMGQVPGQANQYIVLEHGGKIWLVKKGGAEDAKILLADLSPNVQWGPACGLLGMAFHPNFTKNHKYYLQYQVEYNGQLVTHIAERSLAVDGWHDSGDSTTLLEIPGSTQDHNGGCIEFGPDHYLYIAMGDTGPQRDPEGHGQDLRVMKAKMLRIDVDHADDGKRYGIPKDNPFVNQPDVWPEIWAYGFREPWRFSFDRATGDLWLGDVGQDKYEEVDIVRKGENYGWNVWEGLTFFSDKYERNDAKYIPPVFSYAHAGVGVSITGGYVYRGTLAPKLAGHYICADFQVQKVWAVTQTNRTLQSILEIGHAPSRVSSISQDRDGELYLVGYDSGLIYRMDLASVELTARKD